MRKQVPLHTAMDRRIGVSIRPLSFRRNRHLIRSTTSRGTIPTVIWRMSQKYHAAWIRLPRIVKPLANSCAIGVAVAHAWDSTGLTGPLGHLG